MASLEWWYLADLGRFKREREGLVALAARVEWLTLYFPRVDDERRLLVDCDLDIGHRRFLVTLRYPQSFPHSPPSVLPRGVDEHWSGHQFGVGGELCLEYRPDNWSPDIMGWQMVESAYRLLAGENPAPEQHAQVASAHRASEGQRLRGTFSRLLASREILQVFETLRVGEHLRGAAIMVRHASNLIFSVRKIVLIDGSEWLDPSVPNIMAATEHDIHVHITRLLAGTPLPTTTTKDGFIATASPHGWEATDTLFILLVDDLIYGYRVFGDFVTQLKTVSPEPEAARLSSDYAILAVKRVGVIGCGSLGSKVATMLVRSGVTHFVLIDDDLLMPDNMVRHDLDWRDCGQHKAEALSGRLQRIRTSVEVKARCRQLGGQDSASTAESNLALLADCDLIFDATANPVASNILAGFVASANVPVVWAEVFGGGIGGLIARHRPGLEPTIPLMRRAIENWFGERGIPSLRATRNYEQAAGETPFVADDADVTAIAAPAARLALDILLAREPSYFPQSVYVIGLAPSALCVEPFETWPLELPEPPVIPDVEPLNNAEQQEQFAQLVNIFGNQKGV